MDPGILRLAVLFALLVGAAYTDLVHRRIHNWMTLSGIGLGIGLCAGEAVLTGHWQMAMPGFVGLGVGLLAFALPWWLGWLGGGDVKLLGAIGALQGAPLDPLFIFRVVFFASLAGACLALLALIWRGRLGGAPAGMLRLLRSPRLKDGPPPDAVTVPYGLAIVIGAFWAVFATVVGAAR